MATLPTVKVKHPTSNEHFLVINEKDFDPKKHTLWGEKPKPVADELSPYDARKAELEAMGWRELKKLLEDEYGGDYTTKDESIPVILSIEFAEV